MNGILSWNLPAQLLYTPGTVLSMVIILTNPEITPRQYSLTIRLWRNAQLVGEEAVTVDGAVYVTLEAGEPAIIFNGVASPVTDVVLELLVSDAAGEYCDSIVTSLMSAMPASTQVMQALPALLGLGMVSGIISGGAGG